MRLPVPRLLLLVCALMALLPASANAASKGSAYPVITSVSPTKLGIGDVMTITGKNFRKGKNKNTVVFKRDGGRAVFVKAPDATTTKIGVTVPAKLLPFLAQEEGQAHLHPLPRPRPGQAVRQEVHHRGEVAHDRPRRHRRRHQGRLRRRQDQQQGRHRRRQRPHPRHARGDARHRPVQPRHRRRRRVRRLGVLLRAGPQRQRQAGSVRPALPEPAGRQGRRHRPRRRRPHRHPGVHGVGELRRQQAAR